MADEIAMGMRARLESISERCIDLGTPLEGRRGVATRVLALAALLAVATILVRAALAAYYALTDSFVAPVVLSPNSETVLESKLRLIHLLSERELLQAHINEHTAITEANDEAIAVLEHLRASSSKALKWSTRIAETQAAQGSASLEKVESQRSELAALLQRQEMLVSDLEKNLAAGLVRRTDVERERDALARIRIALIQNERERLEAEGQLAMASLSQKALASPRNPALFTPEMSRSREYLAEITLQVLRLAAERRARVAQRAADKAALARLEELLSNLKQRPIFRATERNQNVAFVPYNQLEGVRDGAGIYHCALWGLFGCTLVGRVSEVLPGEVTATDPWGTTGRGQYAILDLATPSAAQAKTLRVR